MGITEETNILDAIGNVIESKEDKIPEPTQSPLIVEDDDDDDEGESLSLVQDNKASKYELPKTSDTFVNSDGKVIDKKDLTPYDIMKAVAKQNGIELKNPKKGCRWCHERGYIGKDSVTKMPIPCSCIFPSKSQLEKMNETAKENQDHPVKYSRKQRRAIEKNYIKELKHQTYLMKKAKTNTEMSGATNG